MFRKSILILILAIVLGMVVLSRLKSSSQSEKTNNFSPKILVTVLPQKQIVEKIAGDKYGVKALVPPGFNPATYDPTANDIRQISQAEVYFRIGQVGFEKTHLEEIKAVNQNLKVVDTSVNNKLRLLEDHDHGEEHAPSKEEPEEGVDPHVWLAPMMVAQQAEVIKNTLSEIYPQDKYFFEKNYQNLLLQLTELDKSLAKAFAPIKGKTMLVYHPAFGYLADGYGFKQKHIQIEGKEPSAADLQKIIQQARAEKVKVIFVQQQFNQDSAQAIAENIGGVVVSLDPLDPDYLGNIKHLAQTIRDNLK